MSALLKSPSDLVEGVSRPRQSKSKMPQVGDAVMKGRSTGEVKKVTRNEVTYTVGRQTQIVSMSIFKNAQWDSLRKVWIV